MGLWLTSGLTAVEDLLQDGAADTICTLRRSGVRLWMLTGDKMETAQFVCKSVGLKEELDDFAELVGISDPRRLLAVIDSWERFGENLDQVGLARPEKQIVNSQKVLILDSESLEAVLRMPGPNMLSLREIDRLDRDSLQTGRPPVPSQRRTDVPRDLRVSSKINANKRRFFLLASRFKAVCLTRCSPSAKSLVAELLCFGLGKQVLAIGDGGNDVGMIQASSIGIGILGKDGGRAAATADLNITRFK